jgi:glycosyltransferase involved in cell wall biosynthesis
MESWVREQGQPHVTLAPPGIDTEVFRPLGEWDPSRPIIAFGRLDDSRKDWPTAVAAYEQFVRSSGLANGLVLAGKGPLHPALRRALDVSPVRDRITIREDVPAAELPSLLASGSVFLQSSLEEGLGLAGLEAMACGLPVVSTATVGAAEYVRDGENGILADLGPSAAVELASGLARVMASSSGTQLSSAGLATVREGYSSAVALEGFVSVYAQLLQSGRGGIRRGVIQ